MNKLTIRFGITFLVCAYMISVAAAAEPSALYKPKDIANARRNVEKYAWARDIVASWEAELAFTLEQDRDFFQDLVPELTSWTPYGQSCPACVGQQSSMGESGVYRWSVTDPEKLTCRYCETTYPHANYPETGVLECPRMGQRFTYFETEGQRAHRDDPAGAYAQHAFRWASWPVNVSWSGLIRYQKASWAASRPLQLAKAYTLTGRVEYAERAAWLLDRLAQVYPHWLMRSYNGTFADCPPQEAAAEMGRHPRAGRFAKEVIINPFRLHQYDDHAELNAGFWGAARLHPSQAGASEAVQWFIAYDLLREARHEDGSPVMDATMRQRVEQDLLQAAAGDIEQWNEINNKAGSARGVGAASGVLFGRPDSVRWSLEGLRRLIDDCYHFDGFYNESPAYSAYNLSNLQLIPDILCGYSDPDGYVPAEGQRIENLDPYCAIPRYRLALEAMVRMLAPGGVLPVIGDTNSGSRLRPIYAEILAGHYGNRYGSLLETVQGAPLSERGSEYALWFRDADLSAEGEGELPLASEWFPGWHVGVLRGDNPAGDTAFYFVADAAGGHRHSDILTVNYWAFGREIATDRGYIGDDAAGRNSWTSSTLAHNSVTVDGSNQVADRRSTLELFGLGTGVQVIQASARAYDPCDTYRRTCALVSLPEGGSYAVDLFRARGGQLHQYSFHADGPLATVGGPAPEPIDEQHRWLLNLRASAPSVPVTCTWNCRDTRMDLTLLCPMDRLVVADAPGWRSARGAELHAPPIGQILAERRAPSGLHSQYAAVMVPYQGEGSPVLAARRIDGAGDGEDAMAVEVTLAGRRDYVISSLDGKRRQFGPVATDARFAFASVSESGAVLNAYMLHGSELTCGDAHLRLAHPVVERAVTSVVDRTIHLAEPLPEGLEAVGHYVLAAPTGFEVESVDGASLTVRTYPAVVAQTVTLLGSASLERTK